MTRLRRRAPFDWPYAAAIVFLIGTSWSAGILTAALIVKAHG